MVFLPVSGPRRRRARSRGGRLEGFAPWLPWLMVSITFGPGPLEARETTLRELSLEDLLAVEVGVATGNPQTLSEVPAVVSVITAEQIERMGVCNLNDEDAREPAPPQIPGDIPMPGRSVELRLTIDLGG